MRRFLLITYYWPPCGGVSVQRWLKLTKYFLQFDWLPTVLTTENGDYPYIDHSLLDTVPAEIEVIRTKTPTFSGWYRTLLGKEEKLTYGSLKVSKKDSFLKKLLFFIRIQFISPDARMIWNRNAYKAAKKLVASGEYAAIITTGPPHSTHLIGLKLKKKFDIKWIADFRDPWALIAYLDNIPRNPLIKARDRRLEKKVVMTADAVVSVSEHCSQLLYTGNKYVITNGFDYDDFKDKAYQRSEVFRIKYIGSLYKSRIDELLQVMKWIDEYAQQYGLSDIEFDLIGTAEPIANEIKDNLPHLLFKNIPFVPHPQAISECVCSEVLLLMINKAQHNAGILTLKLFEYIGSQTFILGVGPIDSDVNAILKSANSGQLFDYDDKAGFLQSFDNLYKKWESGESVKNAGEVSEYSMMNVCRQYVGLLEEVINKDDK